jgi:radical SAM protein with 4Fe4S-binding SPASM domain
METTGNDPASRFPVMSLLSAHPHAHATPRDYRLAPLNVYWEMTNACSLACKHCRAMAVPTAPPGELSTAEGVALLRSLRGFGDPLPNLVLTGGDPLERPDLFELVDEAVSLGLSVAITPSATPRLTREVLASLQAHGVSAFGTSLDGSTAARHDGIRGVAGCFEKTLAAARWAAELGVPLQVNTLVAEETKDDLPAIAELLRSLGIARWSLFFLVSVGRGTGLEPVTAAASESILTWLAELAPSLPFVASTTEAPFYRRILLARARASGTAATARSVAPSGAIRDGHGVVFVSSRGDVCPSGFLPVAAGNVRERSLVDLYRSSEMFVQLHDSSGFTGRCGVCEYRGICGGSRARAFASTGSAFDSDPACIFEPKHMAVLA